MPKIDCFYIENVALEMRWVHVYSVVHYTIWWWGWEMSRQMITLRPLRTTIQGKTKNKVKENARSKTYAFVSLCKQSIDTRKRERMLDIRMPEFLGLGGADNWLQGGLHCWAMWSGRCSTARPRDLLACIDMSTRRHFLFIRSCGPHRFYPLKPFFLA